MMLLLLLMMMMTMMMAMAMAMAMVMVMVMKRRRDEHSQIGTLSSWDHPTESTSCGFGSRSPEKGW